MYTGTFIPTGDIPIAMNSLMSHKNVTKAVLCKLRAGHNTNSGPRLELKSCFRESFLT